MRFEQCLKHYITLLLSVLSLPLSLPLFPILSLSLCTERGCTLPVDDLGDSEQRLALHVVKNKCNFVPEHVEERTLYNPVTPHIPMVTHHYMIVIILMPPLSTTSHSVSCSKSLPGKTSYQPHYHYCSLSLSGHSAHVGGHLPSRVCPPPTSRHLSSQARQVCTASGHLQHK